MCNSTELSCTEDLYNQHCRASLNFDLCTRFIKRGICWLWYGCCILRCLCLGRVLVPRVSLCDQWPGNTGGEPSHEACFLWSHTGPVMTLSFLNTDVTPRKILFWRSVVRTDLLPLFTRPSAGFYLAPAWYDLAGGVITQNNWPHSTISTFHTNN